VLRVLITPEQYQKTRRELVQRFGANPIAASNPLEGLQAPRFSDLGLDGTFAWLTEKYPYDAAEVGRLRQFQQTALEKRTH